MHHQLFKGDKPFTKEKLALDTSINNMLEDLEMSPDFLYNLFLYHTLINQYQLKIIDPIDLETTKVLYQLPLKDLNYTSLAIAIFDEQQQTEENAYLVFFEPNDQLLSEPISTAMIIKESGLDIEIIGSGLFVGDMEDIIQGTMDFNINNQDYSGTMKIKINHAEKDFSFVFETVNNIDMDVLEIYPGFMFADIMKQIKVGDLVSAQNEIDKYDIGNYPFVLNSFLSESNTIPFEFPLKISEESSLIYCDAKGYDRSEYASLMEALKYNYSFSLKDEFYSFANVQLKVIEILTLDGQEMKLYMSIFTPAYIPDFTDESHNEAIREKLVSFVGEQATTSEIYNLEQVNNESRIFTCVDDKWYLVGAGTGTTLLNGNDNSKAPYDGAAGLVIDGQDYYAIYNNQELKLIACQQEVIDIYDSFDIFINYDALSKQEKVINNHNDNNSNLELVSTVEMPSLSFPLALDVPDSVTKLPYLGLDNIENSSEVTALHEYLSNAYSYYKDGEYYSPVWIKLKMMSILNHANHQPFEAFLAIFSPIVAIDELSDDDIDLEMEEYYDEYEDDAEGFYQVAARLIIKKDNQFYIVGVGDGVVNKYSLEYYGDGECIIDEYNYDFNFTSDQFYFVEEHVSQKDRLFYTQPIDVEIDYHQLQANERQRGRKNQ